MLEASQHGVSSSVTGDIAELVYLNEEREAVFVVPAQVCGLCYRGLEECRLFATALAALVLLWNKSSVIWSPW